jgi:hypothetical protein
MTSILTSQYRAALQMLRAAIAASPEELWDDPAYANRTWRIAYHTLFFADLYLSPSEETFVRWEQAITNAEILGRHWEPPHDVPVVNGTNTPEQLLAYLDRIVESLDDRVERLPLDGETGFDWLPFTRGELHIYNIRHIQHHTGQLVERLRSKGIDRIEWVGRGRMMPANAPL